MSKFQIITSCLIKKKIATLLLITVSVASFATLGDGRDHNPRTVRSSFLTRPASTPKSFSLKSSYNFRGNSILNHSAPGRYILLNTVVTYQKGNATYILPLKKKVFLDKVSFKPSAAPRY